MAKNEILLKLKIDDNGNLKILADSAEKASKGLDKTAKSARTADRNIKGAAQTSSNGSKNFSKMAQGIDGMLVPAYAAFAAQMFALSAAFNFFKRAGNLQVLQQGQIAYASATGVAMKSLTKDLQEATGGQVAFTDAASAAAIGTAAGLSADTLERLGKAAKDTSAILGRDVTDSFNRLIRGVTKAEPELLDELGIILRLDDASRKYKEALNITGRELSTFEKSQAVANDVLEQSEEKYSRILDIVGGGSSNEFNKLAVALDDIVIKIQKAIVPAAAMLARVLTDAPLLAGAAFLLLLSGPMKAMGFSFANLGILSKRASDEIVAHVMNEKMAYESAIATVAKYKSMLAGTVLGPIAPKGERAFEKLQRGDDMDAKQIGTVRGTIKRALKTTPEGQTVKSGDFKGFTRAQLLETQGNLKNYEGATLKAAQTTAKSTSRMKLSFNGVKASIQGMAASASVAASRMLTAFGWIGIVATAALMLKDALGFGTKLSEAEQEAEKTREKVKGLNEELHKFVEVQRIIFEDGATSKTFQALGAGLGAQSKNLDVKQLSEQAAIAAGARAKGTLSTKEMAGDVTEEQITNFLASPAGQRLFPQAAEEKRRAFVRDKRTPMRASANRNVSEDTMGAINYIERQQESIALFQQQGAALGVNIAEAEAYSAALASGDADKISETKVAFEEVTTVMAELPRLMKDSKSASDNYFQSLAPLSKAQTAMKSLNAEVEKLEKLGAGDGTRLTKTQKERLATLKTELGLMKAIDVAAHNSALAQAQRNIEMTEAQGKRLPFEKSLAVAKVKQEIINDAIVNKEQEITNINSLKAKQEEGLTENQLNRLAILKEELKLERVKKGLQDEEVERKIELKGLDKEAFEAQLASRMNGVTGAINDAAMKNITLKKEAIDLEEKAGKAEIAREIARMKRTAPLDTAAINDKKVQMEMRLADKLQQQRKDMIEEERLAKQTALDLEYILLDAKLRVIQMDMERIAADKGLYNEKQRKAATKAGEEIGDLRDNLGGTKAAASANIDAQATNATEKIDDSVQATKDALTDLEKKGLELGKGLQTSMEGAFMSMVDGSKSAKEAFNDMAQQVLKMIAKMIIEMMVLKALQAMGIPGFSDGGISEAPKARSGGMFGGGSKLPGYSTGGVSRGSSSGYPVMLHGTEAVVPLPNSREIPVEIKGAAGQVNNVNVSVSVASDGQTKAQASGTDQDSLGKGLGAAISAAVLEELTKQKRNGGALSPYGVG